MGAHEKTAGRLGAWAPAGASLPEPQREAVLPAYFEGHTYRQVAQVPDIPEGTAKARLRRAPAAVAERLADGGLLDR